MGWKIPNANPKNKYQYLFWTVERNPSEDRDVGKKRLLDLFATHWRGRIATDTGKTMLKVVAEKGSQEEYAHYHVMVKLKDDLHWVALKNKVRKAMHFKKENGKGISVWVGHARKGDVDPWTDWSKYVTKLENGSLHAKGKEFDQEGPMELDLELHEEQQYKLMDEDGHWNDYICYRCNGKCGPNGDGYWSQFYFM